MNNNPNPARDGEVARTDGTPISNYPGQSAFGSAGSPSSGGSELSAFGTSSSSYNAPTSGSGYTVPSDNGGQTSSYTPAAGASQFGSPGSPSYNNPPSPSYNNPPGYNNAPSNPNQQSGYPQFGAPAQGSYGSEALQPQAGYAEYPKQSSYSVPPVPQASQIQQAYQQVPHGQPYGIAKRDPNIAFALELLGFVGFLGIGHMYAGNIILGVVMLLFGWGIAGVAYFFLGLFTIGIGFCLFLPLLLLFPIVSGLWARNAAMRNNMMGR